MQLAGTHAADAEQVTSTHPALPILADDGQPGGWIWRCKPERPVGTVAVVMLDIDPKDLLQVAAADDQQPFQHSVRTVRTQRSVYVFALGTRTCVTRISPPSEQNTSLQPRENFASRSRSRNHARRPWSPAPAAGSGPAG
jgi:hypothetical protein